MFLFLPLLLAADIAIEWSDGSLEVSDSSFSEEYQEVSEPFEKFVSEVQSQGSVTRFPHWMRPVWQNPEIEHFWQGDISSIDQEFKECLSFLKKPKIQFRDGFDRVVSAIKDHLQLQAKKIKQAILYANYKQNTDMVSSVRDYAIRLYKNAKSFPAIDDGIVGTGKGKYYRVATRAAMAGLLDQAHRMLPLNFSFESQSISALAFEDRSLISANYTFNYLGHLLKSSYNALGDQEEGEATGHSQLIENILCMTQARRLTDKGNQEKLFELIDMTPVGKRIALHLGRSIVDMIKYTDLRWYGVVYGSKAKRAMLFSIPEHSTTILLSRLSSLKPMHRAKIPGLQKQWLKFPWYQGGENATLMVISYTSVWHLGNRLVVGAMWNLITHLRHYKMTDEEVSNLMKRDDWRSWVEAINPEQAKAMFSKMPITKGKSLALKHLQEIQRALEAAAVRDLQ